MLISAGGFDVLATFLMLLASADAPALDASPKDAWPSSRGSPNMTGRAGSELPAKPELLWKVETKEGIEAGAVIADGVAFIGTVKGTVRALNMSNGEQVWKYTNPTTEGDYRPGFAATGIVVGDLFIIGDEEGNVVALNRKDGNKVWAAKTEGPIHSAPSVHQDRVFVGSDDAKIYCFDLKGNKLWAAATGERVFCSPAVVGNAIVTASCDGQARLLSIKDGSEKKALDLQDAVASTPALDGDRLYVGTMGDSILCLNTKEMTIAWKSQIPNARQFYASPALTESLVIVGSRDRRVVAVDRQNGELKWRFQARGKVDSSPVISGNVAYFGSDDGRVYGVNVADGKEVWKHQLTDKTSAAPAVASGRMVIADGEGVVFCFGAK
jgi:outer membrane protein assembly factor BamB